MRYIKTLAELDRGDLELAGGKGANLGALLHADMPVPPGFCITTAGYRYFVEANGLRERILELVTLREPVDMEQLEAASAAIRALFAAGKMPAEIADEARAAYAALPAHKQAVAVRSSATAEDLPDMSFAGQQDTYLNVRGEAALLDAVARCWASLWTARAIGYRARNQIAQEDVALAVVVQCMVPSEASGVLFTANPLTGKRAETVIDATLGLGEALVSGMVEPDHYVVDAAAGAILSKSLGAKAVSVRGVDGGGTRTVSESAAQMQALPDEQILALTALGARAAQFFGAPQDMEWGWADGRLYVLQSRAVTSLYPLPESRPTEPLEVLFSFASWQGMLDPFSALGQDTFTSLVVGIGARFGWQATLREQRMMLAAGERLFVNITGMLRSTQGRGIATMFLGAVDPISGKLVEKLLQDPRLALETGPMPLKARLDMARGAAPVVWNTLRNLINPAGGRARLSQSIDELEGIIRARCAAAGDLGELAQVIIDAPIFVPRYLVPTLLPGVISGQAPLQILLRLAGQVEGGEALALELTRGLPYNVTTEMDLMLWDTSRAIQADASAREYFAGREAAELAAEYQAGRLPKAAQQALVAFLKRYGMRGVAEIDMYRERWNDNPQHIIQVLKSYLEIGDQAVSPAMVFQNGAEKAAQAQRELVEAFRGTRLGWLKSRLVNFMAGRVRALGGLRETPKYAVTRVLYVLREALMQQGRKLAAAGTLERPDDIFFLHMWELQQLAAGALPGAAQLAAQRRAVYTRELGRKRIPRILLSDGSAFYNAEYESTPNAAGSGASSDGASSDGVLSGTPVSPGEVEGRVHVILDPHAARLAPGEILVCPATDPAWTPLFLAAGGLVMEVGGMMTHGSVVAREYGIPAVVGVAQATTRLKTGQRVRVNGSNGQVVVLE